MKNNNKLNLVVLLGTLTSPALLNAGWITDADTEAKMSIQRHQAMSSLITAVTTATRNALVNNAKFTTELSDNKTSYTVAKANLQTCRNDLIASLSSTSPAAPTIYESTLNCELTATKTMFDSGKALFDQYVELLKRAKFAKSVDLLPPTHADVPALITAVKEMSQIKTTIDTEIIALSKNTVKTAATSNIAAVLKDHFDDPTKTDIAALLAFKLDKLDASLLPFVPTLLAPEVTDRPDLTDAINNIK